MNEYIITCDEETASWIGNDVDSMRPLVRCRDCVHFTSKEEFAADVGIGFPLLMATVDTCDLWANTKCMVEPDGFCAWGVKRKKEGA